MNPEDAVRRWAGEVINEGRLEVLDQICTPDAAKRLRRWIEPFRRAFPDVEMKVVQVIADHQAAAGRFTCSATHLGEWNGEPPSGRRFQDVDEVYFFELRDGLIADYWGLEDTASRRKQLDLG
jgi:predicted ester cyclase